MTTRQDQKQQTRARLIRVAQELFAAQGIAETRTLDVALAAGVSHGTVFLHFPNRDDLVAAVIGEFGSAATRRIHELAERGGSVREVLAAHIAGLKEHEDFYVRLVREGPQLAQVARSTLVGIQSAIAYHLAEVVVRETAAGEVRKMALPLLFNTWIGLLHHYLSNRDLFAPGASVLDRHGEDLLDHMMSLLKP